MRYLYILMAGTALTLAACESTNSQYGLTGEDNQRERARDYSGTMDKNRDNINNNGSNALPRSSDVNQNNSNVPDNRRR